MSAHRTSVKERSQRDSPLTRVPAEADAIGPATRESLAERYKEMAHEGHEHRGVDTALRAFDLGIASITLVVLSPVIATIAVSIGLTSGRPVLYRGRRVGRAGRIFTMLKFRTLTPDAEARLGPYLGDELTQRTRRRSRASAACCASLTSTSCPQLWNVIRGDMSIVGPRPIRPAFFEELCEQIPQYWQRLVVEPGLTGFAQLRMTRETSWAEKLAHDLEYVADRSVHLYLRVCLATAWRILSSPHAGLQPLAMCGICGLLSLDGAPVDPGVVRAMNDTLVIAAPTARASSPRSRSRLPRGAFRSSTSRAPISPSATRTAASRSSRTARSTTTVELRDRLERAGTQVQDAGRHRGARPPLRGTRPRLRRGPARDVRDRALGPARATTGARARSLRDQAALLPPRGSECCRSRRS